MSENPSERRYLAVHLPFLPAERRIRAHLAPPDVPFAIVEKQRGAMRIVALCPASVALGLTPGMALADARARVPELGAVAHTPQVERAFLAHLAEQCERYTPMVEADGEDTLLLDLTGCFAAQAASEAQIARDLIFRLGRMGLHGNAAVAATPDAAAALARFRVEVPARLPVEALRLGADKHQGLRRAGLRTLGDLAMRPRAPLAARFGHELPVRLARLMEEEDRRITPHRAPSPIIVDQRFAEPMTTVAPLLDVIRGLAERARLTLIERGKGGRRFEVTLFRTDGHVAHLGVNSGHPVRDAALIVRLFVERLDALNDPLDPGFGYDMVRLSVPQIEPVSAVQDELTSEVGDTPDFAELLDRLMVRFGRDSVAGFAENDAHLPEYAARLTAYHQMNSYWVMPEAGEPALRPLFLYDPPQRVQVIAEVPDGPPRRFSWQGRPYRVVHHEGPERIAYPWWKHPDGEGPTRDYYRVEDDKGHRFWLFRHGLYGREKADPAWYLHGLFA